MFVRMTFNICSWLKKGTPIMNKLQFVFCPELFLILKLIKGYGAIRL